MIGLSTWNFKNLISYTLQVCISFINGISTKRKFLSSGFLYDFKDTR